MMAWEAIALPLGDARAIEHLLAKVRTTLYHMHTRYKVYIMHDE